MTTGRHETPPASRMLSWLVGCVVIGWLVAYNAMRVAGSNPSDAALPGLAVGAVGGGLVFLAGLMVQRRLAASGRVLAPGPIEIPPHDRMEPAQRDAVALAWPALVALAVAALALGAFLAAEWFTADPGERATTTLILAAWNLLAGLWLGDEALRLRRGEADGIESLVLGCGLTAVLAGVGLSRDLARPGQMVLIVLAGIAGVLVGIAVWRLRGARGLPVGAAGVALAATLALLLPLARSHDVVPARLVCPFDGAVVVDGAEPAPGECPGCGARYAGGGGTPPEAVAAALAAWRLGADPAPVARRLFEVEPPPAPAPGMAITSDSRDGFYLWWLFARGDPADALAALTGDAPAA